MNMKTPILLSLLMAVAVLLSLTGCDPAPDNNGNNNPKDTPKDQSTPISGLFGGNYSATVTGYYSNAQWSGVPDKVKNLLDAGYGATIVMGQTALKTYFENNAVVIKIQSDPVGYTKYKVDSNEPATIYFNLDALDSMTAEDVAAALNGMRLGASGSV